MKEWLNLGTIASYLKMSRASLYKMAQQGRIPATKLGRSWRFDREAVDRWMQNVPLPNQSSEFPWQDCLDIFIEKLQKDFGDRFASVWIYGSWARGDAQSGSDIDLLVVIDSIKSEDPSKIRNLSYQATFGRNRPFVFSIQIIDQKIFLSSLEPLLLNVRREGRKAA